MSAARQRVKEVIKARSTQSQAAFLFPPFLTQSKKYDSIVSRTLTMSEITVPKLSIEDCVPDIITAAFETIAELDIPEDVAFGCFVGLFDFTNPEPLKILKIGTFQTKEQEGFCLECCLEKGRRLQAHPDHISSFQTRALLTNPPRHGGAVRGREIIFSCAGLPELKDEIAMVRAGFKIGQFPSYDYVREIANMSENMEIYDLLKSFAA